MSWALLQGIDSLKDGLRHHHKSHSLYQSLFRSLESVATFEYIVQVKRGHFSLFQTNSLSCYFLVCSEKGIGVSHLTDKQRKCQAICLFCVRIKYCPAACDKYIITWK